VSIGSLNDNAGNTWTLLTGPTQWPGSSFTLMSAIYYVNLPVGSAMHTVTVNLTNPAPLVVDVFAVSNSEITGPPISSAITGPAPGGASPSVTTAPITVTSNSLLLSWVKNELTATATALGGFTLDPSSTGFLWAETQKEPNAGMYSGQFQYDQAIGWQTAIVGLQPLAGPVAFNKSVTTLQDTPVGITLTGSSPQGFSLTYTVLTGPTNGTLSGTAPNLTYTPNANYVGPDAFTFKVNDGTTDSNVATVRITVQGPAVVSSTGYINGTPLTSHTTSAFNSVTATTLVAFVSTNTPWLGLPVSINGLTDNMGNTWNLLTGPTQWAGSSFTLLSAVYYVNVPATSATHTVTANLSNPAPLVMDVFAVSGADVTRPPVVSAITDPGPGGTSTSVVTAPITVSINSLLLSWAKNETGATATALGGFTLDSSFTSFLWPETQTAPSAGSYTGQFQYSQAIGWQTAIVGLQPPADPAPTPVITSNPANPTNQTSASFSFSDTQAGVTFSCQLDGSAFSACTSPTTYAGLGEGSHTFAVEAENAANIPSNAASFTWTIDITPPPVPTITSTPANPTNHTSASFSFSDVQAGVTFLCQLDGNAIAACSSPKTYTGLSQGSHTFRVKAQDAATNQSNPVNFTWTIDTTAPPKPVIFAAPANPSNQTSASFSFSDTEAGVTFLCKLDGSAFAVCSSPMTYPGPLAQGKHAFSVRARDAAGNLSGPASFNWTIDTTPPPTPAITSAPANPTQQTTASFSFTDTEKKAKFFCQLDGTGFTLCTNKKSYSGLTLGGHTFNVLAQDSAGSRSGIASFNWTIN
jgi:hypothetical protein